MFLNLKQLTNVFAHPRELKPTAKTSTGMKLTLS